MPISQLGQLNTTALALPDLYVQIVPPTTPLINGVPTNVVGVVGTATWGPVNAPTIVGSLADYTRQFGSIQPRKYDAGTAVAVAGLQQAANFRIVRVSDGTDLAASCTLGTNGVTLTAKYTGSLGNSIAVTLATGSAASTFKAVVAIPGQIPETFDNIVGTGNAFWVNLAAAINLGISGLRGPSQIVTATPGAGTSAPAAGTTTLTGGGDGATTITGSVLLGHDTVPRTGLYSLRGTGTSVAMLADCDDSTTWSAQVAYGLSEGTYLILVGPSGDTITNAISTKATAGIDSYAAKLLFGDWVYFNDTINAQVRLISPQGFVAGLLGALSPQHSTLNKPLYGIVGTQKAAANQVYSAAELQSLTQAGIDVLTNPVPGGAYFAARNGRNSSSNAVTHGDNYTRMTNYLAATLNAGMGQFIGKLQTPDVRRAAKIALDCLLAGMEQQGQIGTANGAPSFLVVLDDSNNLSSRVALGYMQADVKVTYLSVIEFFIVNMEGGQSVQITRRTTQPAN